MFGAPAITLELLNVRLDAAGLASRDALQAIVDRLGPGGLLAGAATVITEIVANAKCHGGASELQVIARQRRDLLLLVFHHGPALSASAVAAFERARSGWLPGAEDLGRGGLGLPIVARLCRRLTISQDRARVRVWLTVNSEEIEPC